MSETWEQTKARLAKQGIGKAPEIVVIPRVRYEEPEVPAIPLYEIRKITLPIDPNYINGKIVVTDVSHAEADWWLEYKLKPKSYTDDKTDTKTLVFYEKFLIGALPKERSIYSNPARFCTEEFPDLKTPKRVA